MIIEENLEGWNNIPVKSKEVVYPQSKDDKAPKNYFLGIFCGSRGSGKSYLFTKLLKTLEEKKVYLDDKFVPQRIISISSTANSDSNLIFNRQTTSFIESSTEAGILLGGNGTLHAMVVSLSRAHSGYNPV